MGTVVIVVLVLGLAYYFYSKSHAPKPAAQTPAPVVQNPPSGAQDQPPASGAGNGAGDPAALVNQQTFNAHWEDQSGTLMLTTATWANNSNTNITSATLQCRQYNNSGTDLSEYRVTLNGPTNAGASSSFSNISLGATANGMTRVDCSIIHVKP